MSQYIPAIASAIGSAASQAPAIINDSAQEQSNAGVTQNQAPGTNPQGAINATNQVAQTTNNAIAAQNAPAQYAKQKGTEQGEFVQQQGNKSLNLGADEQGLGYDNYINAINETNQATLQAHQDFLAAVDKAKIDPDNFMSKLGTSQRTIAAIGLALSGMGSGLTGQPNLAYDMVQKSIQRDIAAQQQNFQNQYNLFSKSLNFVANAQQNQQISIAAQQAGTLSASTGANIAIQGFQTASNSQFSPAQVAQLQQAMALKAQQAQLGYDELYKTGLTSGNQNIVRGFGILSRGISNHFGTDILPPANQGMGMSRFTLQPTAESPSMIAPNKSEEKSSEPPSSKSSKEEFFNKLKSLGD